MLDAWIIEHLKEQAEQPDDRPVLQIEIEEESPPKPVDSPHVVIIEMGMDSTRIPPDPAI